MNSGQLAAFFPFLNRPMSRGGRKILDITLARSKVLCGLKDSKEWDARLVSTWDPIRWEDANLRLDFNTLRKAINGHKGDWRDLINLSGIEVLGGTQTKLKPAIVNRSLCFVPGFVEIYNYLVNYFFIGDFSNKDLGLIVDLAVQGNLQEIQVCAEMITDNEQRNIAYLAAIYDKRKQILLHELKQQEEIDQHTKDTFSKLFAIHIQPILPQVPDQINTWLEGVDIELALLEERKKLDKNK
jgi:hypothetical protein